MIASYYSVFWKWEFFLLFLHLFNRITSLSFQQIKKKASKKSDFVILLCSIAHPVPGNVCTYSQNTGNLLQYFMNCKDWNALQCRILLHTQQWCGKNMFPPWIVVLTVCPRFPHLTYIWIWINIQDCFDLFVSE